MSSQWGTTGGNLTDFIWQYISQTATLYNWILKIETETKFATLLLKERKNWTPLVLEIELHHEWIYKFSFESPTGGNPTLILPTLPIQKVPKKGFKNSSKMQLLFWTTFLGLECFYEHSKSKRSNQKTKHILIFVIKNIELQRQRREMKQLDIIESTLEP